MPELKVEGAEWYALRCDMQRAAKRKIAGAAAKRFFGADAREVGSIVLLGDVRENQMPRASIEYF